MSNDKQGLKKHTTNINEVARQNLGITRDDYALCQYVQYRLADTRGKKAGWCSDKKEDLANFIGITRPGVYKMLERMERVGLLEIDPPTGFCRVTPKWIDTEQNRKQSLQDSVNKVDKKRKQSLQSGVNKVTHNIEEKEIEKEERECEKEEARFAPPAPAESAEPTHLLKFKGPGNPELTEVVGIALPVEPPKPIQPWEYPNAASPKELKSTLLRYAEQEPDNWRDNVLEVGRATSWTSEKIDECLTDFCAWQFKTDNVRAKLGQYTAGFSLWLKSQKRFDRPQPGASAQPSQRANLNALGSNQAAYLEKPLF